MNNHKKQKQYEEKKKQLKKYKPIKRNNIHEISKALNEMSVKEFQDCLHRSFSLGDI